MLKKLRVKFIVITMTSIVLTLAAIMLTVNAVNYSSVVKNADEVVDFLMSNDGNFPYEKNTPVFQEQERDNNIPPEKKYFLPGNMSKETPFDTRFFIVTVKNGNVERVELDRIAAVSEDSAKEMATDILAKNKTKGTYDVYRYRVKTNENGEKTILFMDISRQLLPMKSFLVTSLIVMSVCFVLFFVVILLISKPVLRPIAESYLRQKRFITDAGHELKTPLTIISANNEIQELETGETECTQAIGKQVARMTTMVKNLTELAKMDEEEVMRMERFDISAAFEDVSATFKNVFEKSGKTLSVKCQNKLSYFGTEAMIRRLFTLLFENASKYSLTFAEAELIKKDKKIVMRIQNDAEGIKEGDLEKCFERFYRSDEARAGQTEGSGIGLSTAQEIVRLHKGKIKASGTADGKFVITVIL